MVEVNRGLYLDEVTGKMGAHFSRIQSLLAKVLKNAGTQREQHALVLSGYGS
jgi:hypothetical protein